MPDNTVKATELTEVELDEVIDDNNLQKITVSRKLENTPEKLEALIGKALYNGYRIDRTPEKIVLYTEKGPVIDRPEEED